MMSRLIKCGALAAVVVLSAWTARAEMLTVTLVADPVQTGLSGVNIAGDGKSATVTSSASGTILLDVYAGYVAGDNTDQAKVNGLSNMYGGFYQSQVGTSGVVSGTLKSGTQFNPFIPGTLSGANGKTQSTGNVVGTAISGASPTNWWQPAGILFNDGTYNGGSWYIGSSFKIGTISYQLGSSLSPATGDATNIFFYPVTAVGGTSGTAGVPVPGTGGTNGTALVAGLAPRVRYNGVALPGEQDLSGNYTGDAVANGTPHTINAATFTTVPFVITAGGTPSSLHIYGDSTGLATTTTLAVPGNALAGSTWNSGVIHKTGTGTTASGVTSTMTNGTFPATVGWTASDPDTATVGVKVNYGFSPADIAVSNSAEAGNTVTVQVSGGANVGTLAPTSFSAFTGNALTSQNFTGSGASLANLASHTTTGLGSEAKILWGSSAAAGNVTMDWRLRSPAEQNGSGGVLPPGVAYLGSDVVQVGGAALGTYALQMTYALQGDYSAANAQDNLAKAGVLGIAKLNGSNWSLAGDVTYKGTSGYAGSTTAGDWGIVPGSYNSGTGLTTGTVWLVTSGGGSFAAVPEPATLSLLLVGGLGLGYLFIRRKK